MANPVAAKKVTEFFKQFPAKTYKQGQPIIQPYAAPKGVYYIEKGSVRQYTIDLNGNEVVVNSFFKNAFIPMSWAINDSENSYFYETMEDCSLRCAPKEELLAFLKSNPDVMYDLLSRLFSGLDGLLVKIVHLMSSSAYVRLLQELVIQSKRRNKGDEEVEIVLPLREYQLGLHCGLTRETVSREFKTLKSKGLVSVSSKGIIIHNLQKLQEELAANS